MVNESRAEEKVGFLDVVKSVLAAFFGVQSGRNRERDFQHGKPGHFILVGVMATVLFVLLVYGVVRVVLYVAGV